MAGPQNSPSRRPKRRTVNVPNPPSLGPAPPQAPARTSPNGTAALVVDNRPMAVDIVRLRRQNRSWEEISLEVGLLPLECRKLFTEAVTTHLTLEVNDYIRWELDHLMQSSVELLGLLGTDPPKVAESLVKLAEARMKLMAVGAGVTNINNNQLNVIGGTHMPSQLPAALEAGGTSDSFINALATARGSQEMPVFEAVDSDEDDDEA